jgi:hypothetical protein
MTNKEAVDIVVGRALSTLGTLDAAAVSSCYTAIGLVLTMLADTQTGAEETASDAAANVANNGATAVTDAAAHLATLTAAFPPP